MGLLPALARRVLIPLAVASEIAVSRSHGVDLPDPAGLDWIEIRVPARSLPEGFIAEVGPGETEVLCLGLERRESVIVLDDAVARRVALDLGLRLTGTLGILLQAKGAGLLPAVAPILDHLQALRFRVSPRTRAAVLRLAGESP